MPWRMERGREQRAVEARRKEGEPIRDPMWVGYVFIDSKACMNTSAYIQKHTQMYAFECVSVLLCEYGNK